MREILFRGKKVSDGEWIEGYYQLIPDEFSSESRAFITEFKKFDDKGIVMAEQAEVVPGTVGEYIGFNDKYGKKIFEDDILASRLGSCGDPDKVHIEGVVKYGSFNCACCDGVYGWYIEEGDIRDLIYNTLDVKGNIHDNPDLLLKFFQV